MIWAFKYILTWMIGFFMEHQMTRSKKSILVITYLFSLLGLKLSLDKSQSWPIRNITFIGENLNTRTTMSYFPKERYQSIDFLSKSLRSNTTTTECVCLQLLRDVASCMCVTSHTRLHSLLSAALAPFSMSLFQAHSGHADLHIFMSASVPWEVVGPPQYAQRSFFFVFRTDHDSGNICIYQRLESPTWSTPYTSSVATPGSFALHKCARVLSCSLTYEMFMSIIKNQVVQVLTDNTTAMCYLNKQGGKIPSIMSRGYSHMEFLHLSQFS